MQVYVDKDGYVMSYAIIGEFPEGIEVAEPDDLEAFEANYYGYKLEDGALIYDKERAEETAQELEGQRERAQKGAASVAESITDIQLAIAELYEIMCGEAE